MTDRSLPRLLPTGRCWCGCGQETDQPGAYFLRGHAKAAEAALLAVEFGGHLGQFLHYYGYGPDRSVLDAAVDSGSWERCPVTGCGYMGAPANMRKHQRTGSHRTIETEV